MSKECCCCSGQEEEIICQSCAMPLSEEELFGTEKDGSKNEDYCIYCYKEGAFTEPDLTIDVMVEKGAEFLTQEHGVETEEAKAIMKEAMQTLKRWRTE